MNSELDRSMIAVGRKMQALLRRHLDHDLTLTQVWVLNVLHEHGSLPLSDVADHLDLSLSAASNVVDQLIHSGWVVRERNKRDRRVVVVSLTTAGQRTIAEARERRRALLDAVLSQLNTREVDQLHTIFQKLEHALSTATIEGAPTEVKNLGTSGSDH